MDSPINISEYTQLLNQIKQRVQLAQKRAFFSASAEMLRMYWDIGGMLFHKQKEAGWGTKFLERISSDLKNDFPDIKGFSVRNCQFIIQFYKEYNQELTFTKQSVSQLEEENTKPSVSQLQAQKFNLPITQIGWAHNVVIMQRVKDIDARDDILCGEGDNQTIGLLLCQNKDKVKAEYALRDINKPIGISEYELGQALPEQLRSSLPSIEEIENNLNKKDIE